jgi:hypothetical protein
MLAEIHIRPLLVHDFYYYRRSPITTEQGGALSGEFVI